MTKTITKFNGASLSEYRLLPGKFGSTLQFRTPKKIQWDDWLNICNYPEESELKFIKDIMDQINNQE